MDTAKEELKAVFAAKLPTLVAELQVWFAEATASIDRTIEAAAPVRSQGSIMSVRPAIDSKRVVNATVVTKQVLDMELPPEIPKPGGYASCGIGELPGLIIHLPRR